ncbi:hypothetical protein B7P43_G11374 [Cryptotermes secundus]|uniref:Uncharacterized protein n=1 Tax=Cryptotermes secundus TaxID=105785 RepID=A0A2J7QXA8_9NEOP|nr:hypothetical protein B7P43_G11374 [Cryptotermes secundus]
MNGPDVHKVMQRKLSVERGKESRNISDVAVEESDESLIRSVQVKPVSQVGVTSPKFETKEGEISVPIQKMEVPYSDTVTTTTVLPLTSTTTGLTKSNFDIIPVNLVADKTKKEHEKDLDFVDSPLGDKLLVPAGSSSNQQSRIEVKKGPNGQDYEYEYVYYYYDDEDNDTIATADEKSHVSASPPTTISTTTERTSTSGKRYLPSASHKDTDEEANHAAATRGRSRNRSQPQGVTEQQNHPEQLEGKPSNGRQRYTTIERNRGEASTTVAPESSNEVLPPSRGSRSRGRQLTLQTTPEPPDEPTPVAEERLPANTRFPPRSRSNHNSATVTTPSSEEALATRGRSSSGNGASSTTNGVRRPSLELVDSSSFRTHSSDASRGQDLTSQPPSFPSVLPSGPFRFLGVTPNEESAEKEVKHHSSRVRGRGDQGTATISAAAENADTETTSNRHAPHIRRYKTAVMFYIYC